MGEKLLISRQIIHVGSRCCKQTAMHITGQLQTWRLVPSGVKQLLAGAKMLGTDQQTSSNGSKIHSSCKKEKAVCKGQARTLFIQQQERQCAYNVTFWQA